MARERNPINSIQNGSVPSIMTNSSSPTPQPDDQLLKRQTKNMLYHQKSPSEVSSSIKRGPTPSTTASSSPGPAIIKAVYEQQVQAENRLGEIGRGSFSPGICEGMENLPQQGNEVEDQCSQTESENVHLHTQNESCTYQLHNHSQSSGIPLYRVDTSTSINSVPSSIQSSQPSLVNNGSGIFPYPHNYPHHHYPYPYSTHILPGPGARAGRAEVGIIHDQTHVSDSGSQKSPTFIII